MQFVFIDGSNKLIIGNEIKIRKINVGNVKREIENSLIVNNSVFNYICF